MNALQFLIEIGRSLLLAILAAYLATSIQWNIAYEACGEAIGENAAGGGAAYGIALLATGILVIIWSILFELVLRLLKVHGLYRLVFLLLPSLFIVVTTTQKLKSIC